MGKPTKSPSRYNKRFSDRMWPDKDVRETPAIDYFEPGNVYNHPDSSVIDYLKRQLKS